MALFLIGVLSFDITNELRVRTSKNISWQAQ